MRSAASRPLDELCHSLLGIAEDPDAACPACPVETGAADCGRNAARLVHLTRAFSALRELRIPAWPYQGPIGIRERSDLHIVDQWRYLGTARNDAEIHAALEARASGFDVKIFRLLAKKLGKLPRSRIVCLAASEKGVPRLCRAALILNLRFKRVACRSLQALPRGSAHQPAKARQPR